MNDPWDVKSVRRSGQYMSCMKINGVPLLPPVLSRECRKEMQYYKLLAKEVEKRISLLQPYIPETESDISDKTDAPELPECEQNDEFPVEDIPTDININKINENVLSEPLTNSPKRLPTDIHTNITSNMTVIDTINVLGSNSPKFIIDLNVNIREKGSTVKGDDKITTEPTQPIDIPERDYDCPKNKNNKEIITEFEYENIVKEISPPKITKITFDLGPETNISDPFPDLPLHHDGPSSLSSKSFTGSLNDLHTDGVKESQKIPKLTRQRSYTLLQPSPHLLAHLEVESLSTGVEMSCISMSESLSNLSTPNKKRRSWDLETAKVKWSSMAMELKQKNLPAPMNTVRANRNVSKTVIKKPPQISPPRARSVAAERTRRASVTKIIPKSEPIHKPRKAVSPVRQNVTNTSILVVKKTPPKDTNQVKEQSNPEIVKQLISVSADPAAKVRELYEKIQKQQLLQMASLVEKQKREQMLLQQVFEEQNNLLYKQLKTICPKTAEPVEAQPLKVQEAQRGPVSLSQLISHTPRDPNSYDSSLSSTLTDTNNYISHCDSVLKHSRDITNTIKRQTEVVQNGNKTQSPNNNDMSRTRTNSPSHRNTSRRLNYDTSTSSDREYEQILTDRTNDTLADLNVTFPSDNSEDFNSNSSVVSHLCGKEMTLVHASPVPNDNNRSANPTRSTEQPIPSSLRVLRAAKLKVVSHPPTAREREAATRIVASAKGYLVRRLMRTDRVEGIVQTIRDALLCALQLHQDRDGIRGADVGLHRRLIQQITAACYSLHDTFITSNASERCAMIAADRSRRKALANRPSPKPFRKTDI